MALISGVLVVLSAPPPEKRSLAHRNFFAVAGVYLLAHAEFIAAVQVIVYAGAIMCCSSSSSCS